MDVKPVIEDLYLIRGFIDFGETIVNMSTQIVFNVLDPEGLDFMIEGPTSEITDHSVRVFRVVVMICILTEKVSLKWFLAQLLIQSDIPLEARVPT